MEVCNVVFLQKKQVTPLCPAFQAAAAKLDGRIFRFRPWFVFCVPLN